MNDVLSELIQWTPSFSIGFSLNLLISLVAMLAGTAIGWALACGCRGQPYTAWSSNMLTGVFRNIPSFVFMFFIAFIIPIEFEFQGEQVRFPAWIKASIALTVPVVGFASNQFYRLTQELKQGNAIALPMFFVSWTQYFVIILMASSTASVIGVHEIVGRANTAIAVSRDPGTMLWIYLYVALWLLLSASLMNGLLKKISVVLKKRYEVIPTN